MASGVKGSFRKNKKNHRSDSKMTSPSFRLHHHKNLVRVIAVALATSLLVLLVNSSNTWLAFPFAPSNSQIPEIFAVEIVNEYPHDPQAFTQGLLYAGNDTLYESTGLYGRSSVRRVALRTGKVEAQHEMDHSVFGEGLTLLGEKLYQVTWLQNTGFIYDQNNLRELAKFTHQMTDGWGLATDGKFFFGSDGSSNLYQFDTQTMKVIQKHTVKHKDLEVFNLNELEFVNGEVWANVYMTDCIARIAPKSGIVSGWILLPNLRKALVEAGARGIDVLNGIAWDDNEKRIFVTGKLWPKLYEIKLLPVKGKSPYNIEQTCINRPFRF